VFSEELPLSTTTKTMNKYLVSLLVISLIAVSAVEMGDSLRARLADRRSKLKMLERAVDKFKAKKDEQFFNFFNGDGSDGNTVNSGGNVLNGAGNGGNALNGGGNALNGGGNALNSNGNFLNGFFRLFFPQVACANGKAPFPDVAGADRFFAPAGAGTPKGLNNGDKRTSKLGNYQLVMQTDCNLVLYSVHGRNGQPSAIWATGTNGKGSGCTAAVDDNGILSVSNSAGSQLWSSAKSGSSANAQNGNTAWVSANSMTGQSAAFIVQDDGNFVAYQCQDPYWATMTNGRTYLEIQDAMKDLYDPSAIPAEVLEAGRRNCFTDDLLACAAGAKIPMGFIPREKLNFHDD